LPHRQKFKPHSPDIARFIRAADGLSGLRFPLGCWARLLIFYFIDDGASDGGVARPGRIVRSIRLSSNSGGGLFPPLAATCALGLMLAGVQPASANSGISTFVPKKGDPDSMSANDFFKLIDKSIPKFKDMIVVIGGCYSSGFSDSAESSKAYKSAMVSR
jgi:hypothetical protein